MSYRNLLQQKIKQLELTIADAKGEKSALEKELMDLKMKEFEEDLAEENNQAKLLKG